MDDIFPYFVVLVLKFFVRILDFVTDFLFSWTLTGGTKDDRVESEQYEKSAHVVDVILKGRSNPAYIHGSHNYLFR